MKVTLLGGPAHGRKYFMPDYTAVLYVPEALPTDIKVTEDIELIMDKHGVLDTNPPLMSYRKHRYIVPFAPTEDVTGKHAIAVYDGMEEL